MKPKLKKNELTSDMLAERWGYHPQTLRYWRAMDRGPRYYKKGKHKNAPIIYKLADIKKYEKSHLDIEIKVETTDS